MSQMAILYITRLRNEEYEDTQMQPVPYQFLNTSWTFMVLLGCRHSLRAAAGDTLFFATAHPTANAYLIALEKRDAFHDRHDMP